MHETPDDLDRLQRLLDDSYAAAGPHLKSITTPERRLSAPDVCRLMTGVQVLHLATVTAAGEPRVGPVDGLFYRGHFHFGSAANSVRFRHIRRRPQVSGSVTHGEALAVTVHGVAVEIDPRTGGFHDYLLEVYGPDWAEWGGDAPYARIDAGRMYTYTARPPAA